MEAPITATALLAEDHQRLRELQRKLDQEPVSTPQDPRIEAFLDALALHSWMEERLVYPLLEKACLEDGLALRLSEAHGKVKRLISEFRLQGEGGGPHGREALAGIMTLVEEHVAEEEKEAFPLLASGAAHNEELGADLVRLREKMKLFPPVVRAVDVAVPLHVAYNQWTQFEDFPRFLDNVKEVRQQGPTHLQWHAELAGKELRWSSEIYEQIPDSRIAWRGLEGALNGGSVSFRSLDAGTTRTLVELTYEPQGLLENLGAMAGMLSRYVASSLESYKAYLERTRVESGAWRGKVEGTPLGARPERGGEADRAPL